MVLRPELDPPVDYQVYPYPYEDVRREYQRHVHEPQQQRIEADVHHHDAQYGHEHPAVTHSGAQQLVMDMVAVRQERVAVLAQTVQHHSRDIQQRHDERRQGQHEITRRVIAGVSRETHPEHQEAQDVAEREAARVAHEQLVPAPFVAEHVVEPEGHNDAQGGDRDERVHVFAPHHHHDAQNRERDAAQTGREPVDAVNQVDRVRYVHDHHYRQRHACPRGYFVDAEQPPERMQPRTRQHHQAGGCNLHGELGLVAGAYQVIGLADHVEHGEARQDEQHLHARLGGDEAAVGGKEVAQTDVQRYGDKNRREERQASEPGNRRLVHLSGIGDVEKLFLIGNQEYPRDEDEAEGHGYGKTSGQKQIVLDGQIHSYVESVFWLLSATYGDRSAELALRGDLQPRGLLHLEQDGVHPQPLGSGMLHDVLHGHLGTTPRLDEGPYPLDIKGFVVGLGHDDCNLF